MRAVGFAAVALVIAVVAGPLASSKPDGLERVAADTGFAGAARPSGGGPLFDFALSGVAGTLLVLAIGFALAAGMRRWVRLRSR